MTKQITTLNSKFYIPYLYDKGHLVLARDNTPGQIFSHIETDTGFQRHYDVSKLGKIVAAGPPGTTIAIYAVQPELANFLLEHSGIEQPRLDRLTPSNIAEPGLMIHLADGHDIIVDGNHRYVRRHQIGLETMSFFVLTEAAARPALLAIPSEWGHDLASAGRKAH